MLFQYLRVKRCLTENLIGWKGWGKSETLERGRKKGTKRITAPRRNCSIYWISQTVMNETVCDWQDCTWNIITAVLFELLRYTSRYVVKTASFGCVSILREDCISSTGDFKRHSRALIHPATSLQISYEYMGVSKKIQGSFEQILSKWRTLKQSKTPKLPAVLPKEKQTTRLANYGETKTSWWLGWKSGPGGGHREAWVINQ